MIFNYSNQFYLDELVFCLNFIGMRGCLPLVRVVFPCFEVFWLALNYDHIKQTV